MSGSSETLTVDTSVTSPGDRGISCAETDMGHTSTSRQLMVVHVGSCSVNHRAALVEGPCLCGRYPSVDW